MKGLFIKDLRVIAKQLKLFFAAMIIMLLIPNTNLYAFSIIYAAMMPFTILAYDERSKWEKYELMLPVSKRESTLEKYIIGYGGVIVIGVLALLLRPLVNMIAGANNEGTVFTVVVLMAMAFIVEGLYMPILLKLGVEKGRLIFLLSIMFVGFLGLRSVDGLGNISGNSFLSEPKILLIMLAAALLINFASIAISVKIKNGQEA